MIKIDFKIKPKTPMPEHVECIYGNEYTYDKNGKYHSYNDQPAVVFNTGTRFWYKHGKRHRENGPAIIYSNGYKQWWLNGKDVT